jgi:hypothetical protein
MRYTYLGVSQLRYGILATVVSVTIIKQTTQHNTFLSRWPILAIKRVPLYSLDGQYQPSGESTVCGWPISAVNGLCFLLMANIGHQEKAQSVDGQYQPSTDCAFLLMANIAHQKRYRKSVSPSRWPISANGRVM